MEIRPTPRYLERERGGGERERKRKKEREKSRYTHSLKENQRPRDT